jgi:hypothetical protein
MVLPDLHCLFACSLIGHFQEWEVSNDISNCRLLPSCLKLLVYMVMYEDPRGRLANGQYDFIKGRSTVYNFLEYSIFHFVVN